jgi:hypothetical protein
MGPTVHRVCSMGSSSPSSRECRGRPTTARSPRLGLQPPSRLPLSHRGPSGPYSVGVDSPYPCARRSPLLREFSIAITAVSGRVWDFAEIMSRAERVGRGTSLRLGDSFRDIGIGLGASGAGNCSSDLASRTPPVAGPLHCPPAAVCIPIVFDSLSLSRIMA